MSFDVERFIARAQAASERDDAQAAVAALLREVLDDPDLPPFLSGFRTIKSMADMAFHRSPTLTLLAAAVPPGFESAADVIHAIANPLDEPLLALHAYGGDLLATPRSSWDPETGEEIPFAFDKTIPATGAEGS